LHLELQTLVDVHAQCRSFVVLIKAFFNTDRCIAMLLYTLD
jgi:hypothetical protein